MNADQIRRMLDKNALLVRANDQQAALIEELRHKLDAAERELAKYTYRVGK